MNCAECKELLVASLEGLLDDSRSQAVEEHIKTCEICRAELKGLQTLRDRLIDNGGALGQGSVEDEVMNRILREQGARLKSAGQAGAGLRIRSLIMRSSVVKIAVAAAVVLVALGAWSIWSGTQSGVALADVLAKVEQIRAFMYRVDHHMKIAAQGESPGETDTEMTVLFADGYGMRVDASTPDPDTGQMMEEQLYLLPERKIMLRLTPTKKTYERVTLDDSMFEARRKEGNDPRLMIRKMLECSYEDLGKTVLDGVEVRAFRTTDPAFTGGLSGGDATLWVDVKTGLPFHVERKIKLNEQSEIRATQYDFQWDVPVSAAQFDPVIPPDFTPGLADGTKAPAFSERGAIEGLEFAIEFFGKYPESLDPGELMRTFQTRKASLTPAAKEFGEELAQAKSTEERIAKVTETMKPLQSLLMFHLSLVAQKQEPAYYGNLVEPGDKAGVVLRWKLSDNEYRVIFGDLHAETVDAQTLATLEAAVPK